MTHAGFTGTSKHRMTDKQAETFVRELEYNGIDSFVHGDCIGCDEHADELFRKSLVDGRVIILPGKVPKHMRAFCGRPGDFIATPTPPLERNKDIVNQAEIMFATPNGFEEELRSGTWMTIRYARRKKKRLCIIWPDGTTRHEST